MIKQEPQLYQLDLTGNSPFNKVTGELKHRAGVVNNSIFVPLHAPFYQDSVKMYFSTGELMTEGEDYEFYGIMSRLTQFTNKPVGLYIRLLKDTITDWSMDYQVVGNFNKITDDILQMLKNISEDDRHIDWNNLDNKPLWYVPELHQHDWTYEFFGFQDLAEILKQVSDSQSKYQVGLTPIIDAFEERLDRYIAGHEKVILDLLHSHSTSKHNNHGTKKDSIGLDKVDDFKTATLEETIEGTSTKLKITPFNAAKAAEVASARNQRLFPAGSLPLARYGADTFIPPIIGGSFEGMGGLCQRGGVNIEQDGTMLITQSRYDGRTRGLYFLRSSNYYNPSKVTWEFVPYAYTHPTAAADGATIDSCIDGSNKYIMVIGDSVKNIWYWVETKGTFFKATHVLHRLPASFMTEIGDWGKASVIADKNYKKNWMVVAGQDTLRCKSIRPSYNTKGQTVSSNQYEGFTVHVMSNLDGNLVKAIIDYTLPTNVRYQDELLTLYERVWNVVNGVETDTVASYNAIYDDEVYNPWTYHSLMCLGLQKDDNTFNLRIQFGIWLNNKRQANMYHYAVWKGSFKITPGAKPRIVVTRAPGEGLYHANPIYASGADWNNFALYKMGRYAVNDPGMYAGFAMPIKGEILTTTPASEFTPVWVQNFKSPIVDADSIFLPDPVEQIHPSYSVKTDEYNPIGLGSGFWDPVFLSADSTNPLLGGMMAKQNNKAGIPEWVFRRMDILNANWTGIAPTNTITMDGTPVKYYTLLPQVYKTNLGNNVLISLAGMNTTSPHQTKRISKMFGCDVFTRLMGDEDTSDETAHGDGLWMYECKTALVAGVVTFTPVTVINVLPAIENYIKPALRNAGYDVSQISNAWSIIRNFPDNSAEEFQTFVSCTFEGKLVNGLTVNVKITPKGSPVTKNGYQYYADSQAVVISNIVKLGYNSNSRGKIQKRNSFATGTKTPITYCSGDWVTADGMFTITSTRWTIDVVTDWVPMELAIETTGNGTTMTRVSAALQKTIYLGDKWTAHPAYGLGSTRNASRLTGGCGIVCQQFAAGGSVKIWDAFMNDWVVANNYSMSMNNLLPAGYILYFQEIKNVMLSGKCYDIPAQVFDIRSIDSNPANKTYHVYIIFSGGKVVYKVTTDIIPESPTNMLVAHVFCGSSQIDRVESWNRFTMVGIAPSDARQGSVMLPSSGGIYDFGTNPNVDYKTDLIP